MDSRERAHLSRECGLTAAAIMVLAAVFTSGMVQAQPAQAIGACGITIRSRGEYSVTGNLLDTSGGTLDCIRIAASNVTLRISNTSDSACKRTVIQGKGSRRVGIHILHGAQHVLIDGGGSIIAGWGIGIEDEGDSAAGFEFYLSNNASDGLMISGASKGFFTLFFSGLLVDSSGSPCFPSLQGQEQGVRLQSSRSTEVAFASLEGNQGDGFSEAASRDLLIRGIISGGNLNGFEFVGGGHNHVFDNLADTPKPAGSLVPNTGDGFDIGRTEIGDVIAHNNAFHNGNGITTFDIDSNRDIRCRRNRYIFNRAGTFDQRCVLGR
jgi:hypothetical protein